VPGLLDTAANQLRVAKRLALRRGATLAERFGALDDGVLAFERATSVTAVEAVEPVAPVSRRAVG